MVEFHTVNFLSQDLQKNGNNPVILYGFGAFGFSQLPKFTVNKLVFIGNLDGIFAVANIRGGR